MTTHRESLAAARLELLEALFVAAEARLKVPYDWHDTTRYTRDEMEAHRATVCAFVVAVQKAREQAKKVAQDPEQEKREGDDG